ncbi:MAG TPA: hypothetical protein VKY26_07510, partial [Actinomycetota bacterium]|nr:hypothetical protein [Actinomycetota bacterium]
PGLAEITVRLREGYTGDRNLRVTVQPVQYKAGLKGAPPADVAVPVPGAPGTWSGELWLMVASSYSVRVDVQGAAGEGVAQVPVLAEPTRVLGMDRGLGVLLACLGLFLFAGAVSIVGAAVREGSLPVTGTLDDRRCRRARVVVVVATLLFAAALWGGKRWWDRVDGEAQSSLFKPFRTRATVALAGGRPVLTLAIDDPRRHDWTPLIPDHGKLMHLFLLREPGLDAFAHLHPVAQGDDRFLASLPPLPSGSYRVYADVVHESGFPQTLVDRVTIPASLPKGEKGVAPAAPEADPDDSIRLTEPLGRMAATAGPKLALLEDGGSMLWHQEPLRARQEVTLRFEVRGADGEPPALEPYMGMLSHAVITRDDGRVFVHLHPMGTVSMAAQQAFEQREGETGAMKMNLESARPGALSFPYEFPRPGRYRLWVQVKIAGKVQTAVFDTEVGAAG